MKVLLINDVYKLGRAGDVKKVAAGYGRNYLIPQGLAVLATPGALKQADSIREQAATRRAIENKELSGLADQLSDLRLTFPVKAGDTGKLYGSVTTQMIAEAIQEKIGVEIDRRQIDAQPIRNLGLHKIDVRLTIDLVPEVTVVVHREGESPESAIEQPETEVPSEESEKSEVSELIESAEMAESEEAPGAVPEEVEESSKSEEEMTASEDAEEAEGEPS